MRKFAIAFLRSPNPCLHSDVFKVQRDPASYLHFGTLATLKSKHEVANPGDGEVGGSKHSALSDISMGALERRKKTAQKKKADKTEGVEQDLKEVKESFRTEISTLKAKAKGKGRPKASEKARKKGNAVAVELDHMVKGDEPTELTAAISAGNAEEYNTEIGIISTENVIVCEYENAELTQKSEDIVSHAKSMTFVHKECSEFAAKLGIHTFKHGESWKEIAHKLLDYGISLAHVSKMLRRCKSLYCSTSHVDSTLQNFTVLGMSHEEMGQAISGWPTILNISNSTFQGKVQFFVSAGIDVQTLGKMIRASPLAIVNPLIVLQEHFAFWNHYLQDVQQNAACVLMSKNAWLLTYNLEKSVKPKLAYLEEWGFEKKMMMKHSILLSIRLRNLQTRFNLLLVSGFSLDQVQTIVLRCPRLLTLAYDHINLKVSYAVNVMNLSLEVLVACPMYWTRSFEKKIKYRYEIIKELQTQGALRRDLSLCYMLSMTEADFAKKFVEKLKDCGTYQNDVSSV